MLEYLLPSTYIRPFRTDSIMVLILDCNSEICADVRSNLCYQICLRHFIRLRAVTNRILFSEKAYFHANLVNCTQNKRTSRFYFILGQHVLSYHLMQVPWHGQYKSIWIFTCKLERGADSFHQAYCQPWDSYQLVTQNILRTHEEKQDISEKKKNRFFTSLDPSKCLKQIKKQKLLLMCASISKLPSNISTILSNIVSLSAGFSVYDAHMSSEIGYLTYTQSIC